MLPYSMLKFSYKILFSLASYSISVTSQQVREFLLFSKMEKNLYLN